MFKVVFMGTPDFAVPILSSLIQTQSVVGVVTQPDKPAGRGNRLRLSPVKVMAKNVGIPLYQPKSLRKKASIEPIVSWKPDIIVVAAFGQILRPHILNLPSHGCLNIHASLLPRWRGASPIQHALLAGDKETGVCLMQMDEGIDTGNVYTCQSISIEANETASTLHDKLAQLGAEILKKHLDDILAGKLSAISQDDSQATYAPLIKKEDGQLDWQKSAVELERQIRAMTPWPSAFTQWQGKRLKVLSAKVINTPLTTKEIGTVNTYQSHTIVHTSKGSLALQRLQLEGKKAMDIDEFLQGQTEFIGSQLG